MTTRIKEIKKIYDLPGRKWGRDRNPNGTGARLEGCSFDEMLQEAFKLQVCIAALDKLRG